MKYLSIFLLTCLLFVACNDDSPGTVVPIVEDPTGDDNLVSPASCDDHDNNLQYSANRNFAFDLLQAVNEFDAEKNVFTSPMSVSIALTMLYNGTNGAGKAEMDHVMHLNGIDLETLNQNYFCLLNEIVELDDEVILNIANSIWTRNNFQAKEEFVAFAEEYLESEFFSVNFTEPGMVDVINGWISDKTEGKITDALDMIPGNVVMYLINAIYFNADWKYSFDPEFTYQGNFTDINGGASAVDFMTQTNDYRYTQTDDYQAIDVPYGNDNFSLTIFLPSGNVNDFLTDFSESAFVDAIAQMQEREVLFTMPKFELEYKILLNDALKAMGMNGIFQAGSLENIQEDYGLMVSRVIHQTFLEIDEMGTEAAGVTIIEIVESTSVDGPPTMIVNRPFVFYIRDRVNNNVLFSGKIVDPNL